MIKIMTIFTFIICFNTQADDPFSRQQKKCQVIDCTKSNADEALRCKKERGKCFRDVFKNRIEYWKIKGIRASQKKDVLRALNKTREKNVELIERLDEERKDLDKTLKEVIRLQDEVKSLKPAK